MLKEVTIAFAEVVEPWISVSVIGKTVLGTFAVTGEKKVALSTLLG